MKNAIANNYNEALKYVICEDWIYENTNLLKNGSLPRDVSKLQLGTSSQNSFCIFEREMFQSNRGENPRNGHEFGDIPSFF